MRVPESPHGIQGALAMQVRRMWISLSIAKGMMTTVSGYPKKNRPLGSHGTKHSENGFGGGLRLKSPVRKLPVKAYADAEYCCRVKPDEQYQVNRANTPPPENYDRRDESQERDDHRQQSYPSRESGCAGI